MAREPAIGAVLGGVALLAHPDAVFELAKLGVSPAAQGRGTGRLLVEAAIERARALGAVRLFLGSKSKLAPAIHLYEDAGFVRITRDRLPVSDYDARADVLMELPAFSPRGRADDNAVTPMTETARTSGTVSGDSH